MSTAWLVKWKRNRVHRGQKIVFSEIKEIKLADRKRNQHCRVWVEKLKDGDSRLLALLAQ